MLLRMLYILYDITEKKSTVLKMPKHLFCMIIMPKSY